MTSIDDELATNKRAWDHVAAKFAGGCALPNWGPFGECRGRNLLGKLEGATMLEVGCGSGHSIARAVELGAARVYGIDISAAQIALASEINRAHIEAGRVQLFEAPMEQPLEVTDIDVIFSIQALGWTREPTATFRNLAAYLRPGGRLVWSWGHPLFSKVFSEDGKLVLRGSYFDEEPEFAVRWSGSDGAVMQHRTIASWFRHLAEAGFTVREYLEPEAETFPPSAVDASRFYSTVKARAVPCTIIFVCEKTAPAV